MIPLVCVTDGCEGEYHAPECPIARAREAAAALSVRSKADTYVPEWATPLDREKK